MTPEYSLKEILALDSGQDCEKSVQLNQIITENTVDLVLNSWLQQP